MWVFLWCHNLLRVDVAGVGKDTVFLTSGSQVVPVPIADEAAMRRQLDGGWGGRQLVDRDGGIFDALGTRKSEIVATVKAASGSPYEKFLAAMPDLTEVLVEDAWPLPERCVFAGACRFGDTVIDCLAEEAIGLALAAKRPICIDPKLYEQTSIDAEIGDDGDLVADDFGTRTRSSVSLDEQIPSSDVYFAMSQEDKLRALVNAGIAPPRPRYVRDDSIEDVILPQLDEIVRREVQIVRAVQAGDLQLANFLTNAKSDRHKAYDEAKQARRDEDLPVEAQAQTAFNLLTATRADPTQDPGSYDRYLDKDDWYEEQRRRTSM